MSVFSEEQKRLKANIYKKELARYKKATNHGFYLEAMVIAYSAIEDRLKSFLLHIGIVKETNKVYINSRFQKLYRKILNKNEKENSKVQNISEKISFVRNMFQFTLEINDENYFEYLKRKKDINYLKCLMQDINKLDKEEIIYTLNTIEVLIDKRNKIIHALINNKATHDEEEKKEVAEGLFTSFRKLDILLVKKMKKDYHKKFNIQ